MRWYQSAALYLLLPALALVAWGELYPNPTGLEKIFSDKVLHFIAYFGLAGIVCVVLNARRSVVFAVLGLALFGAILEVVQGLTGGDMSFYDELANMLGAACGTGTGWVFVWLVRPKMLAAASRN